MNKLEIRNRTVITVTRYVVMNDFEYTIDHINRVRLVGYIGSEQLSKEVKSELQSKTVAFIRSNISSIVNEMDLNLLESTTSSTDSRVTAIELA